MAQDSNRELEKKGRKAWPCAVLGAIGLIALSSNAFAIDWTIGGGVGVAPDYEGSEDYEAVPLLHTTARDLYHPDTYVQFLGNKLNSNFLPHENFRLGMSGQYIAKRDSVDNSQVDALDDVNARVLLGLLVGYDLKLPDDQVLGFEFDPRWDPGGNAGGLYTMRVKYAIPLDAGTWRLFGGIESTYASGDYMEEYFSIGGRDSRRSGLDEFDADDGFKDFGLNLGVTYKFATNWSTTLSGSYKRLLSDAEDSPVTDDVGSANQGFFGARLDYSF